MSFITKVAQLYTKKNAQIASMGMPDPQIVAHLSDARIHLVQGEYKLALLYCQEALKLNMANGDAYRLRSAVRHELNDSEGALDDLRLSLKFGNKG